MEKKYAIISENEKIYQKEEEKSVHRRCRESSF